MSKPKEKNTRAPVTVMEGQRVANTRAHDAEWAITGYVVSVKRRLAEVRVERAVRRDGGAPAPEDDPWRRKGAVVRSAAWLWRGL